MAMRTKTVKIDGDIYTLTAVPCDVSGAISIELLGDFAPLIIAFLDGNIQEINKELRASINSQKVMRMLTELINFNILEKNGELVNNWKIDFACKPLTMFRLGYEALRFNCEDFFTFISGFAKERNLGQNWNEVIENYKKEGMEVPPMFSLLFQNGDTQTDTEKKEK